MLSQAHVQTCRMYIFRHVFKVFLSLKWKSDIMRSAVVVVIMGGEGGGRDG